jgi:hypothetical protein
MISFTDPFLAPECNSQRQAQARQDITASGTYSVSWTNRLIELRTYIIACQECMAADGDLYSVKLKAYEREFSTALNLARADNAANGGGGGASSGSTLSAPILRA